MVDSNVVYSGTLDTLGTSILFRGCPFFGGINVWVGGEQCVHCSEVVHSSEVWCGVSSVCIQSADTP